MSTELDPTTLTSEALAVLQAKIALEQTRRGDIEAFAAEHVRSVESTRQLVQAHPPVVFEPVPTWYTGRLTGHPPGQHIIFDGALYLNAGDCYLALPPSKTLDWTPILPEAAPPEPEPEPEPEGPEAPRDPGTPTEPEPQPLPEIGAAE